MITPIVMITTDMIVTENYSDIIANLDRRLFEKIIDVRDV